MITYLMNTIKYSFGVVLSILMSFLLIDIGTSATTLFMQLLCLLYSVIFVATAIFFAFYATKNWTEYKTAKKTAKKDEKYYKFLSRCERMNDIYKEDPIGDEIDRIEEEAFQKQEQEKPKSVINTIMIGVIGCLLLSSCSTTHNKIGATKGTKVCHEECYFKTMR